MVEFLRCLTKFFKPLALMHREPSWTKVLGGWLPIGWHVANIHVVPRFSNNPGIERGTKRQRSEAGGGGQGWNARVTGLCHDQSSPPMGRRMADETLCDIGCLVLEFRPRWAKTPPQPQATANLCSVSTVLPFSECHAVGTVPYAGFSDGLLSLNNVLSRFLPHLSVACRAFECLRRRVSVVVVRRSIGNR